MQEGQLSISKHEQRELNRNQREEAQVVEIARIARKKKLRSAVTWFVVILAIGGLFWLGYTGFKNRTQPYTSGPVHWHAKIDVEICGVNYPLEKFGSAGMMEGPMLTHTHGDGVIHVEGQVWKKEDIALGNFFDGFGLTFTNTSIIDKKNGDLCSDGKSGTLRMYVNNQQNTDFRDYIIRSIQDPQKQVIKIVFEP